MTGTSYHYSAYSAPAPWYRARYRYAHGPMTLGIRAR